MMPPSENAVVGSAVSASEHPLPFDSENISIQSGRLAGRHAGMVVFSSYPADPRPRRAAEALLKEGMSVDLVCEVDDNLPRRERSGGLDVTRIPIRHFRGGALSYAYQYSAFIAWSTAILITRMLRRRYDLVYVHNMPDVLVISALLPKLFGAKVILDQHDPMPELMMTIFRPRPNGFAMRVIRRLERWSIARADVVITVNEACRKIFSRRSCPVGKISVIMNCPDEEIFPHRSSHSYPVRPTHAPLILMYHGSLVERNGLGLAVDALALVVKTLPGAELRIYGRSTPYLEQVMEKVHSLGLENNVHFIGPRKLEDLAGEIERCDVGVIPNQQNTFTEINTPTRIFEYLATGKPVIAPSTAGILDYFGPGSLLFFRPGDTADLANAIEFVAKHPREAVDIAEAGRQVYLEHTWQREREKLVGVVAGLVGAGARELTAVAQAKRTGSGKV
jgi:glycosyltransferase involved in cell wall biosynthesis